MADQISGLGKKHVKKVCDFTRGIPRVITIMNMHTDTEHAHLYTATTVIPPDWSILKVVHRRIVTLRHGEAHRATHRVTRCTTLRETTGALWRYGA